MNCPDDDKLIAFVEQELSPEEQTALKRHIEQCDHCSENLSSYETVLSTLHDRDRPEVDPAFTQRVLNEAGFELHQEQTDRTGSGLASGSVLPSFIRRNASWIASLSLHCCLIFLLILLAVRQFRGDLPSTPANDVYTGIPVSSAPAPDASSDDVREHVLWRGRFRQLRTGPPDADTRCGPAALPETVLRENYESLLELQNNNGSWSSGREDNPVSTTALTVLAFLRGGHRPDVDGTALEQSIRKGLAFLITHQNETGRVGAVEEPLRAHVLATASLLEASILSPDPGLRQSALDALEYLHRQLADASSIPDPDYWTFASLQLGRHLGHARSEERLNELARIPSGETEEDSVRLAALPFLSNRPLSGKHKRKLKTTWNAWQQNPSSILGQDDPISTGAVLYSLQDSMKIKWNDLQHRLNRIDVTGLTTPLERAKFALTVQTCRAYPH